VKLTCDARALLGALDECAKLTPVKTTLPVLHQALLVAGTDGTLSVTTTDLLVRVTWTIPASVDVPGSVLAPARRCAEWLDEIDDLGGPIALELAETRLHWTCGPYRARTLLADIDDFPPVAAPDLEPELVVDLRAWASIADTLLAAAHDQDVGVHADGDRVILSAIGRQQAVVGVVSNHGEPRSPPADWSLPARALAALHVTDQDLRDGGEPVRLAAATNGRQARLWRTGVEVIAQMAVPQPLFMLTELADGLASDDQSSETCLEVDRRELQRSLTAGALLKGSTQLIYQPRDQVLQLLAHVDGERVSGDTRTEVTVERGPRGYLGIDLELGDLRKLVGELRGRTVRVDLADMLGGPGLRVSPADALPDNARVLIATRATALAEGRAEQAA